MNKFLIMVMMVFAVIACNNNTKTVIDEQKQRDSIDAAQRIKDSLEVEAKMLMDMEADSDSTQTTSSESAAESK